MTLALYRIDDRLIHGQVVVGWGQPLNASFIVLVDDEVSGSDWEQDLYRMGVPPQIEVIFASVEYAADQLPGWEADARVGILLVGDIDTAVALTQRAPPGRRFDDALLSDLPREVDPCGENGEFHSFVTVGPMFDRAISVSVGETVIREGFAFTDLLPA